LVDFLNTIGTVAPIASARATPIADSTISMTYDVQRFT
jgi:hypothetical protein